MTISHSIIDQVLTSRHALHRPSAPTCRGSNSMHPAPRAGVQCYLCAQALPPRLQQISFLVSGPWPTSDDDNDDTDLQLPLSQLLPWCPCNIRQWPTLDRQPILPSQPVAKSSRSQHGKPFAVLGHRVPPSAFLGQARVTGVRGLGKKGGLNHRSAQSGWPKVLDNPCLDDPASEALANHRSRCSCGVLLHLACLVCFFQDSTHQQQEHRHDMSSPLSRPRLMLIPSPHVRATAKTSSHFDTTQSTL